MRPLRHSIGGLVMADDAPLWAIISIPIFIQSRNIIDIWAASYYYAYSLARCMMILRRDC